MPRFVILEHDHPFLHWDLMLEDGTRLRTWRLEKLKLDNPGRVPATSLSDHRLWYLDYEGPVSGDRGRVKRWDAGSYEELSRKDDRLEVRLNGARLVGTAVLQRINDDGWTFQFCPDSA